MKTIPLFQNLSLDVRNKEKALLDTRIFVEKFISINGDNEEVFTKDRPAYLIKISSNDENELTSMDAKSSKSIPLQCTEAFFDSKKSVTQGKICKKLSMVFRRENEDYFTGCNQQLEIQFGSKGTYGYFKTIQYAEEVDIQNVFRQFLEITDVLNSDFVEDFDYWLATLPRNRQKNITASMIAAKFDVNYSLAELMLKYAEEKKILERYYLVKCPECDDTLIVVSNNELAEVLSGSIYCSECDKEENVTTDNIYIAYRVVKQPDVSEEQIYQAIEKKFIQKGNVTENFFQADSLSKNINYLYEEFYNPGESAYLKFKELREKLDLDYGKNTTAKGQALETLVCAIFNKIPGVRCTTDIKTRTNQFDCTALCGVKIATLSIFSYLAPYFIIECKNEPQTKPDNNYCNKLLSIMDTNDAQIGIVFGRMDAASTCFKISRDHYLIHKNSGRHKIIITCSDQDLDYIIDKRVNLLKYLEFKISCITIGSVNASYEMFEMDEN